MILRLFSRLLRAAITDHKSEAQEVFVSGEALTAKQVEYFRSRIYEVNGAELINLYEPTEADTDVTYFDTLDDFGSSIPIGKPISNIKLYILSKQILKYTQRLAD